jgi:hypothetical protein
VKAQGKQRDGRRWWADFRKEGETVCARGKAHDARLIWKRGRSNTIKRGGKITVNAAALGKLL